MTKILVCRLMHVRSKTVRNGRRLTWLVIFEQQHEWHDVLKSTSISVSAKFVKIDLFLDSHPSISIWCSSSIDCPSPIVWPMTTWLYIEIICTHTTHILNQSEITLFIRNQKKYKKAIIRMFVDFYWSN